MELTPYVPRLVLEWARDTPEARYRGLGGTLAFCDLSGFTAMSEKLAALGRLGAEELADVLNLLFSALLDDAASYGGSLLKYGGDAVLLFFEGDGHAARGVAATHRMRATLRRLGTVKTSRGVVRVRMSVGIHSGEFDCFLVGDSHRELIVTGPGATTALAMEAAAEAGEILLSRDTAAALAPSCVGEPKADGLLLKRIPRTPSKEPGAWGEVPDTDPLPFIPVGLRDHVGGVGADAEHRHIAVGFVAFGGVDALLAARGGDATARVLDEFIGSCQAAFARFEVCFLYADAYDNGGKVFFVSGAPVSHEDNEERILRAALEISSTYREGLHLHTGLNRGYVFAGDIGARFRRTYTVLGDAVNTAARVMASCTEDNQVRAMPEVLDLASSWFVTTAQPPFAAKGKTDLLATFAVGEAFGPRLSDTPLPLVGRATEFAELSDQLAQAKRGTGGVVRVVGPQGVGKSRLVEELRLRAEADGFATVTTFAERYEQTSVYFVLRQLMQVIFGGAENDEAKLLKAAAALAPGEEQWFPLLGPVVGLDLTQNSATSRLDNDETTALLGRLIVALLDGFLNGPSLWVAENAHLADDASANVIAAVGRELQSRPWVLVTVSRDDEPGGLTAVDGDTTVVGPLSDEDAIRLARTANPTILPNDAARIAKRSGGNPLFLRQLVTAAIDGGELSDSVETAVSARIDRLATADREVLRTAAVLGGRFSLNDLRELLDGRAPDLAPLKDFVAVVDGAFVFRQTLYRDVAYAGLTFRRRRDLHMQAGRLLEEEMDEDEGPIARLSLHFHNARAWDRSWRYSKLAGEKAYVSTAKSASAVFYDRALEAGRHLPDVSDLDLANVASELGQSLYHAGKLSLARRAYRTARRLTPKRTRLRAHLDLCEAVTFLEAGEPRKALPWFRRGLIEFEESGEDSTDPDVAETGVSLLIGTADVHMRAGRFDAAGPFLDQASDMATRSGVPRLISRAHNGRVMSHYATGDIVNAEREARLALEAAREDENRGLFALQAMNLGALSQALGKWGEAAELYDEALAIQLERGNDMWAAATQVNIGELLIDLGQWDEARRHLTEATNVLELSEDEGVIHAGVLLNRLDIRTNVRDTVEEHDDRATVGVAEMVALNVVEAALSRGDFAGARSGLDATAAQDLAHRVAMEAALCWLTDPGAADATVKMEAAIQGCRDEDDVFGAVLLLSLLGRDYRADAASLGLVDLPRWAKPAR